MVTFSVNSQTSGWSSQRIWSCQTLRNFQSWTIILSVSNFQLPTPTSVNRFDSEFAVTDRRIRTRKMYCLLKNGKRVSAVQQSYKKEVKVSGSSQTPRPVRAKFSFFYALAIHTIIGDQKPATIASSEITDKDHGSRSLGLKFFS